MARIDPPAEISTSVCLLRRYDRRDWPLEQALSEDPDVVRWTLYPPDLTSAAARARLERTLDFSARGLGARYAVTVDGVSVGSAGIALGPLQEPEVFYALLPSGRGLGAATAAAGAFAAWALGSGWRRVLLVTLTGNDRSEGVARRAGFSPVGVEVREQRGTPREMLVWERGVAAAG